jgi:hypothetical protein
MVMSLRCCNRQSHVFDQRRRQIVPQRPTKSAAELETVPADLVVSAKDTPTAQV